MITEPAATAAPAPLSQRLAAEALRFIAATQAMYVVVLHAGWMLLLLIAMDILGAPGGAMESLRDEAMRAFRWLGGVDRHGHGGMPEIMSVWAKLSLLPYLMGALLQRWRSARQRWTMLRKVLLSTAIATIGYAVALSILPQQQPDPAATAFVVAWLGVSSLIASVWAFGASALAERAGIALRTPPHNRNARPARLS